MQEIGALIFLSFSAWIMWNILGGSEGVKLVLKGYFLLFLIFLPALPLAYVSGFLSLLWVLGSLFFVSKNSGGGSGGGMDGSNY
jgi:hypothetical protein